MDHHRPKIIGITEFWCTTNANDTEVSINDYLLYRGDLVGLGGGVLLYIHRDIQSSLCILVMNVGIQDSVWCIAQLNYREKALVGVIYRSPSSSVENTQKIIHIIKKFSHFHTHCSWETLNKLEGADSLAAQFLDAHQLDIVQVNGVRHWI